MDLPSVVWFTPSFPMPLTGVKSTRMQIQKSIDAAISPWPSTRHSKLKLSLVLINFAKVTAPMQNHWLKSRTWYLWAIGPMPSAYFVISSRCTINSKSLKSYKSPKATSVPSNPTFTNYSPLHEKNYKNNQTSNKCVWLYTEYNNEAWKITACPGPMLACNRDCLDTAQMELDTNLHFICSDKTSNCSCCMIILNYKPTWKKPLFHEQHHHSKK